VLRKYLITRPGGGESDLGSLELGTSDLGCSDARGECGMAEGRRVGAYFHLSLLSHTLSPL